MGFNCINTLLFATTLLYEQASQKISLKCNTLNLFQAFATLKKKLNKTNALASQMTLFVIYSCRNYKYMGLYGNLNESAYSGKFFTVNSLLTKQRHFIRSCGNVYYNMVDLDTAHFMTLFLKKCERTMNSHLLDIGSHYLPWKWSNLFKVNCINRKTKGLSKPTFKCYLQLFFSLIGGPFLFFHRFAIDILSP